MKELLREIPQVDRALGWSELRALAREHPRERVAEALRSAIEQARAEILAGALEGAAARAALGPAGLAARARERLERRERTAYRRVINATGILLHTGLGRAVLPAAALDAARRELAGYSIVEVDAESGERNERESGLREILRELTGAEAATVVNNNAAATLLALAALARGGEVVVSRGQLVEIGGSFRIPDILAESGARLVEVGTTNRTYLDDYRRALCADTRLLLRVHTSNYEIRGFVHQPALSELVALGRERGVPVVSDLGSGCLVDVAPFGFRREPLVRDSVAAGADLVTFSGDKLLGGPQAGLILGRAEAVRRVRRHPLYRALRVDKVTLTLLEATLRIWRDPERALEEIPALRSMATPIEKVHARAAALLERARAAAPRLRIELVPSRAAMGSGALPAQEIESRALALESPGRDAESLAASLRGAFPPIFSRRQEGRVRLDVRTLLERDEDELIAALAKL